MLRVFAVCLLLPTALFAAAPTPYSVATLVHESDDAVLQESLRAGLAAPEPLVRAAAARVIAVRGVSQLLPLLREAVKSESDPTAAREELRALALLGENDDVSAAVNAASRFAPSMDDSVAIAVARRGGTGAIDLYRTALRETRMSNEAEFFRVALWGRADLLPYAAARLIGNGDEKGWQALLDALLQSDAAIPAASLVASFTAPSETIRSASVWYAVHAYAADPQATPPTVQESLRAPRAELSSDREDFGLELARRMLGAEKKDDPRWQRFLGTTDADQLFARNSGAVQYLTDEEYSLRYARCEVQARECAMPRQRTKASIPSIVVAPPAFNLPSILPAGLADAIVTGAQCNGDWIGVADVLVDRAGRVQTVDTAKMTMRSTCRRAVETLLRMSYATNTSLRSRYADRVMLVHPARTTLCLDEDPPGSVATSTFQGGGDVAPPKVLSRVEPQFPESSRRSMGARNVVITIEAVISKTGCLRSLRLLEQSPYPELNGAAVLALSQWKFAPGRLEGQAVDVLFNLTINFTAR